MSFKSDAAIAADAAVVANTAKVSADGPVTSHSDMSDAGSGSVITASERTIGLTSIDTVALVTSTNPYRGTSSTSYETLGYYDFQGTDTKTPTKITAIVEKTSTTMDIRIQDLDSGPTIAELTGITDTTFAHQELSAPANLSAAAAVWAIQALRTGGGGATEARCASLGVVY